MIFISFLGFIFAKRRRNQKKEISTNTSHQIHAMHTKVSLIIVAFRCVLSRNHCWMVCCCLFIFVYEKSEWEKFCSKNILCKWLFPCVTSFLVCFSLDFFQLLFFANIIFNDTLLFGFYIFLFCCCYFRCAIWLLVLDV